MYFLNISVSVITTLSSPSIACLFTLSYQKSLIWLPLTASAVYFMVFAFWHLKKSFSILVSQEIVHPFF